MMAPGLRKLALTAHVVCSVGWLGAVIAFTAFAVLAATSSDVQLVRAVYLAAEPVTQYVIVPLAVAALLTGLLSSLGTAWGLFRHYWVIFKLILNLLATILLLMYLPAVSHFARLAQDPGTDLAELRSPTFLLHSTAALLLLTTATVLAVYKPQGLTTYGRRKAAQLSMGPPRSVSSSRARSRRRPGPSLRPTAVRRRQVGGA